VRVLVTGGRGFVGSHLVEELTRRGHDVGAVGRADGDLAETGVAERLLTEHAPEVVVHLAATVGRLPAERDPAEAVRQNVGATLLVARACAAAGARLAFGSTTEVYGPTGERPATEDDLPAPAGVYALSKRWGEEAALSTCPDATLLRLSLPYGPGVVPGRGTGAIVNMLDQARRRMPIPAYRDAVRSWCWVGDVVRGIALVLETGQAGAWNVGRDDDARALVEVARLACALTGAPVSLIEETDSPDPAAAVHRISTAKLRALGWEPEVDLEQGMRLTLESLPDAPGLA